MQYILLLFLGEICAREDESRWTDARLFSINNRFALFADIADVATNYNGFSASRWRFVHDPNGSGNSRNSDSFATHTRALTEGLYYVGS